MTSAHQLRNEGFERLTEWELRKDKIKPKATDYFVTPSCLYAFVINDEDIGYIGLTTMVLISRLDHYSYGKDSTNKRVRQSIEHELKRGNSVAIYGRSVADARLDAEERRMINAFNPPWNRF